MAQKCVSRWWQYILIFSAKSRWRCSHYKRELWMDHVFSSAKLNNSTMHINVIHHAVQDKRKTTVFCQFTEWMNEYKCLPANKQIQLGTQLGLPSEPYSKWKLWKDKCYSCFKIQIWRILVLRKVLDRTLFIDFYLNFRFTYMWVFRLHNHLHVILLVAPFLSGICYFPGQFE